MNKQNKQLTDPEYLERWAAAYTLAKSIPNDDRFDMQNWAKKNHISKCGTAACLAGHAILHSWFIERGFKLRQKNIILDSDDNPVSIHLFSWGEDNDAKFWGINSLNDCPFDPNYCAEILEIDPKDFDSYDINLTPQGVAKVVYCWMLLHWPRHEVDTAIAASTVCYSADEIHKNAPWNQE